MLHEALVRGILRSAPPRILRAVEVSSMHL